MLVRSPQRLRDRRGAAVLLLLAMMIALMGILSVVIDTSRLMALKSQMQTAVDAAALAGAFAIVDGAGDGARDVAIAYALKNYAEAEGVVVEPEDITFGVWDRDNWTFVPLPSAVGADAIDVQARRDVTNYLAWILGAPRSGAWARATAWTEAPVSETDCVKPWSIPMELIDANNDDTVEDWEIDAAVGDEFTLKSGTDDLDGSGIPSFFYAVVLPPFYDASRGEYRDVTRDKGGADYRQNISECDENPVGVGDSLVVEPGEMGGPTIQGARALCGEIVNTYCNPAGTYSPDGRPGMPIIATLWDSDVDPIGRKNVRVASLGSFRVVRAWKEPEPNDYAVVVGRFERMSASGTVSGNASTVSRTILVR